MKIIKLLVALLLLVNFGCQPEDNDFDLGASPAAPEISIRQLPESPNFVEIQVAKTDGVYDFIWDAPGGSPNFSQAVIDTIFYAAAGEYDISAHISAKGGNGTSTTKETVVIAEDAQGVCDDFLEILTGGCETKCWKLSEAPGSIKVGPSELSGEFFTSAGLDDTQIDDRYCFTADGLGYQYLPGDGTFSACAGYVTVQDFPNPPDVKFSPRPANSIYGDTELSFSAEIYMGTEDSGNTYLVTTLTEDEMVLVVPIAPCDGAPSPGFFTYTFEAAE